MNRLSFYLLWETLCFVYNIAVDSVNMDALGNQSVQILSRDNKQSKKRTEIFGYHRNQRFFHLNKCGMIFLYRRVLYFWIAFSQCKANMYDTVDFFLWTYDIVTVT